MTNERPAAYSAAVITLSDRAFSGLYEDRSGPLIREMLTEKGYLVRESLVLPDDAAALRKELIRLCDEQQITVIFTSGGTGFSERDITPETTEAVCEKIVPGIGEALRAMSLKITPKAILSRQTAGIRGRSLIVNLPGSPKAVRESLEVVLPVLPHAVETLSGNTQNCGGNYGK